jgi:hypothetical protein
LLDEDVDSYTQLLKEIREKTKRNDSRAKPADNCERKTVPTDTLQSATNLTNTDNVESIPLSFDDEATRNGGAILNTNDSVGLNLIVSQNSGPSRKHKRNKKHKTKDKKKKNVKNERGEREKDEKSEENQSEKRKHEFDPEECEGSVSKKVKLDS